MNFHYYYSAFRFAYSYFAIVSKFRVLDWLSKPSSRWWALLLLYVDNIVIDGSASSHCLEMDPHELAYESSTLYICIVIA